MNEELMNKLLTMPLSGMEKEDSLASVLRCALSGEENSALLHLQLFLGLRQAQYKVITLQDIIDAARGEIVNDPIYRELTLAMDAFMQSDALSSVHKKPVKKMQINMQTWLIGQAISALVSECTKRLSDREKRELYEEGKKHACSGWDEYLGTWVRTRINSSK